MVLIILGIAWTKKSRLSGFQSLLNVTFCNDTTFELAESKYLEFIKKWQDKGVILINPVRFVKIGGSPKMYYLSYPDSIIHLGKRYKPVAPE